MSEFTIQLHDKGRCRIKHNLAGAKILTDLPPEYGGDGRSFSSTDLVAAAMGSCILTSIDSFFEQNGYDPGNIKLTITKTLSTHPKMIKSIHVEIFYPEKIDDTLIKRLDQLMKTCPVKRSLNNEIEITNQFISL